VYTLCVLICVLINLSIFKANGHTHTHYQEEHHTVDHKNISLKNYYKLVPKTTVQIYVLEAEMGLVTNDVDQLE